jgi:hypothetical protein
VNSAPKMIAKLPDGSLTLLEKLAAEGTWAWDRLVGWGLTLWGVVAAVASGILGALTNNDTISIVIAVASLYVAARAFQHDRQMGSLSGLSIQSHAPLENVHERKGQNVSITRTSYVVVEMLARGPGTRYEVRGAVWAPKDTVIADVRTPQLQLWKAGDDPITVTIRKDRDHSNRWEDVYVGAVWVRPGGWLNRFVVEGVRVNVSSPGSREPQDQYQTWSHRKGRWVDRKPLKIEGSGPLEGSVKASESLADQSLERHPSEPDPLFDLFGSKKKPTGPSRPWW